MLFSVSELKGQPSGKKDREDPYGDGLLGSFVSRLARLTLDIATQALFVTGHKLVGFEILSISPL